MEHNRPPGVHVEGERDGRSYLLVGELISEITDAPSEPQVFGAVARYLLAIVPGERASVALPTPDGRHLEVFGLHGEHGTLPVGATLPIDRSGTGQTFRSGETHIRPTDTHSPMVDLAALAETGIREVITAPLTAGGHTIGTLNVGSARRGRYTDHDVQTMRNIARLVAAGVDRWRLDERATRTSTENQTRIARLELLNEIAEELSACRDEDQAHQALLHGVQRLVPGAPRASVVRFDDTLTRYRVITFAGVDAVPMGWRPVRGASFEQLIARGTATSWLHLETSRFSDHRLLFEAGLHHTLSIPMRTENRIVGAVNLGLHGLPPDEAEILEVLRTLGKLGGATLDRLAAQARADAALGALIDGSPVLLLALDATGRIDRVSRLGAAALGYQGDLLVGQSFGTLHPNGSQPQVAARAARWAGLPGEETDVDEVQMLARDGRVIWARQSARVVRSGTESPLVLVACEDITSVRELTSTLLHQARHDALTGLPNRRSFEQELVQALADSASGPGFALLFIDLDRFKAVNDGFGHGTGDALLCAAAARIRAELKGKDLASRIGGDEFQVLLRDVGSVHDAVALANSLRVSLLSGFDLDGHRIEIGCSIGISVFPGDGTDPEELTRRADVALGHAKRLGRNNVQLYRPDIDGSRVRTGG